MTLRVVLYLTGFKHVEVSCFAIGDLTFNLTPLLCLPVTESVLALLLNNQIFKYSQRDDTVDVVNLQGALESHIYLRVRLINLTADASVVFASCSRLQSTVIYDAFWHHHKQNILVHLHRLNTHRGSWLLCNASAVSQSRTAPCDSLSLSSLRRAIVKTQLKL